MPKISKYPIQPMVNKNKHKITMSTMNKKGNIVKRVIKIFSDAHMKEIESIPKSMRADIIKKFNQDIRKLDNVIVRQNAEKESREDIKKRIKKDIVKRDKETREAVDECLKNNKKTLVVEECLENMDRRKRFLTKTNVVVILSTANIDGKIKYGEVTIKLNFSYDCCPSDIQVSDDIRISLEKKPYYTFRKILNISTIDTQKRVIPKNKTKKAIKGAGIKNFGLVNGILMFGCKLNYHFSKDYDTNRKDNNMCVIDYLRYELQGCPRISQKLLTRQSLLKTFEIENLTDGISLNQITNFVNQSNYISMYAFSPSGKIIKKIRAKGEKPKTLVFMINNSHIYPIINNDYKKSVIKKECLELSDYKFDINYDNCTYVEDIDNLFECDSKVKLIPESYDFTNVMHTVENNTTLITTNMKWSSGRLTAHVRTHR